MAEMIGNERPAESDHDMDALNRIKKELEGIAPGKSGDTQQRLIAGLCGLIEGIMNRQNETQRLLDAHGFGGNLPDSNKDNFGLSKREVKGIILKETSTGQVFYPSDIADKHNLDLRTVILVINELRENKQIAEKG